MIENPYQSPRATAELFDAAEAKIVAGVANPALTHRRILFVVLASVAMVVLMLTLFWHTQPKAVLWLFIAYTCITMFEKVGYGLGVLLYKSVIRKLLARVSELESRLPPKVDLLGNR